MPSHGRVRDEQWIFVVIVVLISIGAYGAGGGALISVATDKIIDPVASGNALITLDDARVNLIGGEAVMTITPLKNFTINLTSLDVQGFVSAGKDALTTTMTLEHDTFVARSRNETSTSCVNLAASLDANGTLIPQQSCTDTITAVAFIEKVHHIFTVPSTKTAVTSTKQVTDYFATDSIKLDDDTKAGKISMKDAGGNVLASDQYAFTTGTPVTLRMRMAWDFSFAQRVYWLVNISSFEIDPWFNTTYARSTNYQINGTNHSNVNFPFLFNLSTANFINNKEIQADCDDLTFTDANESAELSYIFDSRLSAASGCNTANTLVWVKLPNYPNVTGNTSIFGYHNASSLADQTDTNVFTGLFNENANARLFYPVGTLNTTNITDYSNNSFTGWVRGSPSYVNTTHGWAFLPRVAGDALDTQRYLLSDSNNGTLCMRANVTAAVVGKDFFFEGASGACATNCTRIFSHDTTGKINLQIVENGGAFETTVGYDPPVSRAPTLLCIGWGEGIGRYFYWNGIQVAADTSSGQARRLPITSGLGRTLRFGGLGHYDDPAPVLFDDIILYDRLLSNQTMYDLYSQTAMYGRVTANQTQNLTVAAEANTAPSNVTLVFPANASFLSSASVMLNWTNATDANGDNLQYYVFLNDALNVTVGTNGTVIQGVRDGFYSWGVNVTDAKANSTSNPILYFTVDTVQARTLFITPTEQNNTFRTFDFVLVNVSVFEVNLANVTFGIRNSTWSNSSVLGTAANASLYFNFTRLSRNSQYIINASVYDSAGNVNVSEELTITLDDTQPRSVFISPTEANDTFRTFDFVSINASLFDLNLGNVTFGIRNSTSSIINITYLLANGANVTNVTVNFTKLSRNSRYTYNVTVYDRAGNVNTSETRTITLDNVQPASVFQGTDVNNTFRPSNFIFMNASLFDLNLGNITFGISNETHFNYTSLYLLAGESNASANSSYNFSYTGLSRNAWYVYNMTVYDRAGNVNTSETRTITLDDTSPRSVFVSPTEANDTFRTGDYVFLNMSVFEVNLANVTFGIRNATWSNSTTISTASNLTLYLNFSRLSRNSQYLINATTYDRAGNVNVSETRTITLDNTQARTSYLSQTPANNSFQTATTFSINVSVFEVNLANVTFWLFNTTGIVNQTFRMLGDNGTNMTITYTTLVQNLRYEYNATIYDRAGNVNVTETRILTLDNVTPVMSISTPAGTVAARTNINLTYVMTDSSTFSVCYRNHSHSTEGWGANTEIACGNQSVLMNVGVDGAFTNWVFGNDSAGNFRAVSRDFSVDTAGVVQGSGVAGGGGGGGGEPVVSIVTKKVRCSLNGSLFTIEPKGGINLLVGRGGVVRREVVTVRMTDAVQDALPVRVQVTPLTVRGTLPEGWANETLDASWQWVNVTPNMLVLNPIVGRAEQAVVTVQVPAGVAEDYFVSAVQFTTSTPECEEFSVSFPIKGQVLSTLGFVSDLFVPVRQSSANAVFFILALILGLFVPFGLIMLSQRGSAGAGILVGAVIVSVFAMILAGAGVLILIQ